MYLSVQEQDKSNFGVQHFETRLSACALCAQNRTAQSSAGAELGSFTSFSVCSFRCRRTQRRARFGLAVHEMRLFACASNTARKYSVQLFCFLRLNALNSFESLNWQGLKTRANDKL